MNLCASAAVVMVYLCVQREIRCTKEGKWTAEFSMCSRVQGSCSPPPDLNSVEYSCDQGTDVGEWALKVNSDGCSVFSPSSFICTGSLCYPTCIVTLDGLMDLRDPVVLPNSTSADSLKHWMLPSKVLVRILGLNLNHRCVSVCEKCINKAA